MTIKTCLDNLKHCKASCCKILVFGTYKLDDEQKKYYTQHGCVLMEIKEGMFAISVPSVCQFLKDDLCTIHDTDDQPQLCRRSMDDGILEGTYVTGGCIYGKKGMV